MLGPGMMEATNTVMENSSMKFKDIITGPYIL